MVGDYNDTVLVGMPDTYILGAQKMFIRRSTKSF
jgi:hypothetical protein